MKHVGTQDIISERLLLRKFSIHDAEAMFYNWASDSDVVKYLTWPAHPNVEVTESFIQSVVGQYENLNTYQWIITLKNEEETRIGSISVVEIDESSKTASIGYCIGKRWWHQGFTSEALQSIIPFLFEEVGFNRIEATHDSNNPNSGAVMKKAGMTFEGVLRQAGKNQQGICDKVYYSILAEEYYARKS